MFRLPFKNKTNFALAVALTLTGGAALYGIWIAVQDARERRNQPICEGNLRRLGQALAMYVQDNDGYWPSISVWEDKLGKSPHLSGCPSVRPMTKLPGFQPSPFPGYAYNRGLSRPVRNEQIVYPFTTVSVSEQANGISYAEQGDPLKLAPKRPPDVEQGWKRHRDGANYLFCDNHVSWHKAGIVEDANEMSFNNGVKPTFSYSDKPVE